MIITCGLGGSVTSFVLQGLEVRAAPEIAAPVSVALPVRLPVKCQTVLLSWVDILVKEEQSVYSRANVLVPLILDLEIPVSIYSIIDQSIQALVASLEFELSPVATVSGLPAFSFEHELEVGSILEVVAELPVVINSMLELKVEENGD